MYIHIGFGINDNYCQHCACMLASILYNSSLEDEYVVHLISDHISDKNLARLKSLESIRKFELDFIKMDTDMYDDLNVDNTLDRSTFYRFKAFELEGFDKIIYLDVDMVCRKDIGQLYRTDVDGFYLAGAEDLVAPRNIQEYNLSSTTHFINAGMILINLNYCREHEASKQLNDFVCSKWDRPWNDQAIINRVFQDQIKPVDITWNYTAYPSMYKDQKHFLDTRKDPSIVHFIGFRKPWNPAFNTHLKSEYFKYLRLTPWYDEFMVQYNIEQRDLFMEALVDIKNDIKTLAEKQS